MNENNNNVVDDNVIYLTDYFGKKYNEHMALAREYADKATNSKDDKELDYYASMSFAEHTMAMSANASLRKFRHAPVPLIDKYCHNYNTQSYSCQAWEKYAVGMVAFI